MHNSHIKANKIFSLLWKIVLVKISFISYSDRYSGCFLSVISSHFLLRFRIRKPFSCTNETSWFSHIQNSPILFSTSLLPLGHIRLRRKRKWKRNIVANCRKEQKHENVKVTGRKLVIKIPTLQLKELHRLYFKSSFGIIYFSIMISTSFAWTIKYFVVKQNFSLILTSFFLISKLKFEELDIICYSAI